MTKSNSYAGEPAFEREVRGRFGILPNFFRTARVADGLVEQLWGFARSAYLDNPLPSLFKERLFVHLSRFCEVRYCIVRHAGFLIGEGYPAGDPAAAPHSIEQLVALLRRSVPDGAALDRALERLGSRARAQDLPSVETQAEADLFDALAIVFLVPQRATRAQECVRTAVGDKTFELLTAFLAFVRTAHFWTETHQDLAYEPDMLDVMERHPELAELLLDTTEAAAAKGNARLREVGGTPEAALQVSEERQTSLLELSDALQPSSDSADRSDAALRDNEPRLRIASEAAQLGVFEWTPSNDTVSWENDRMFEIFGRSREAGALTAAMFMADVVHPDDAERFATELAASLTCGQLNYTGRFFRADGALRWVMFSGKVEYAEDGTPLRMPGVTADVTERMTAEQALRESEERYRTLFERIDEGFCIADRLPGDAVDFRYVAANPAFERQTGLENPIGRTFRELVPAVEEDAMARYARVADGGESETFSAFGLGKEFHIEALATGRPGQIAVLFRDVTLARHAEEALRQSEARYQELFASSPIPFMVLAPNPPDYTITAANEAYLAATLRTRENLIGRRLFDVFTDDPSRRGMKGSEALDLSLARVMASRRTDAMERVRYDIVTPEGGFEPHWWLAINAPVLDASGEITAIIHQVDRQTELHLAEEAQREYQERLRESEEQQRLMIQLVPALLWWADPAGTATTITERWRSYTGQSDAETQNFGWLEAVHPDDRVETRAAFTRAFATGEPLERQQRIHRAGNGYRWHLVRHVPVRDASGAITRWSGAAIDVHESRELQDRQQVLVAELQHRTRNLMGVVRSMSDATMRASTNLEDFEGKFHDRLRALARVQGLLSRLAENDRITFDELLHTELTAHGAIGHEERRVRLTGPAHVPLRSSTVQTLALALHELSTNAIKHGALGAPRGRLAVEWRLEPAAAGHGPLLHIDWRESGVAMPDPGAARHGSGQGRELIERALPYQVKAKTSFELGPDGLHCTITLPVSDHAGSGSA